MSLLMEHLAKMKGNELVVVMSDSHSYRGVLVDYDTEALVLKDVKEGSSSNLEGWEEPTVSTGITRKLLTVQGVFSQDDTDADIVRFKDVLIRLNHVIRIYQWTPANLTKPEFLTIEKPKIKPGLPRGSPNQNRDF